MVKKVIEGKLYLFFEYEWWDALITDKDKETLLKELNKGEVEDLYEDRGDHIWRIVLDTDELRKYGVLLRDVLDPLHGKKVRIVIEEVEE